MKNDDVKFDVKFSMGELSMLFDILSLFEFHNLGRTCRHAHLGPYCLDDECQTCASKRLRHRINDARSNRWREMNDKKKISVEMTEEEWISLRANILGWKNLADAYDVIGAALDEHARTDRDRRLGLPFELCSDDVTAVYLTRADGLGRWIFRCQNPDQARFIVASGKMAAVIQEYVNGSTDAMRAKMIAVLKEAGWIDE